MPAILDASSLPAVMFASAAVAAFGFIFTVALTRESQHTDIMQPTQQNNTAGGETDGGSAHSTDSSQPARSHSTSARHSLPSLSLSRAIRKARGYTDLLKQQSSVDELEDEPAHIDMDDMDVDEFNERMYDEHRMDESDDDDGEAAAVPAGATEDTSAHNADK